MTKYDLELQFKALALAKYNKDRSPEDSVGERDVYFQAYLDGMVWSMVPRQEIEAWIEYYERKLAE
jgi:hypothetical protein